LKGRGRGGEGWNKGRGGQKACGERRAADGCGRGLARWVAARWRRLWVDLVRWFALVGGHVRKVAPRLLLMLAGPVVFFGLLEGVLYLTGRFEPLSFAR
jgi:hypothetical protein